MKKTKLFATLLLFFVMAAASVKAQQTKAPATQSAGEVASQPVTSKINVQAPPIPANSTVQKNTTVTEPVAVSKPAPAPDQKPAELKNAPAQTGTTLQNADRPKISTIIPNTTEKPLANEGPKTPGRQQ